MAAGVGVAGGVAGGAGAIALARRSREDELSTSVKVTAQVGFGTFVAGGMGAAGMSAKPVIAMPLLALSAVGGGLALATCALEADRFNSVDEGLNALEHDDFSRAHDRRIQRAPLIGAGIGAATVAGLVALQPRTRTPAGIGIGLGVGAAIGGAIGLVGAAMSTASGQERAYAPSSRAPGHVAATLFEHAGGGAEELRLDLETALAPAEVDEVSRRSGDARTARFYATADAQGDGDGTLTSSELEAHVRSFDADRDGSVAQPEWEALHAAILAP